MPENINIPGLPAELINITKDGLTFKCKVQPKASKEGFCGVYGDAVKITLTAPPVEGKANKALINFLSKQFKVAKSSVEILSGETSKIKYIRVKR